MQHDKSSINLTPGPKQRAREKLENDVAAFIKRGKKITVVPPQKTKPRPIYFNEN